MSTPWRPAYVPIQGQATYMGSLVLGEVLSSWTHLRQAPIGAPNTFLDLSCKYLYKINAFKSKFPCNSQLFTPLKNYAASFLFQICPPLKFNFNFTPK